MFTIEVRPKRVWRSLRMKGARRANATTRHKTASHWFQFATANGLVGQLDVRSAGRMVAMPPDRWRVTECGCTPLAIRGRLRRRT